MGEHRQCCLQDGFVWSHGQNTSKSPFNLPAIMLPCVYPRNLFEIPINGKCFHSYSDAGRHGHDSIGRGLQLRMPGKNLRQGQGRNDHVSSRPTGQLDLLLNLLRTSCTRHHDDFVVFQYNNSETRIPLQLPVVLLVINYSRTTKD